MKLYILFQLINVTFLFIQLFLVWLALTRPACSWSLSSPTLPVFPSLSALPAADYLDEVYSFNYNVETFD